MNVQGMKNEYTNDDFALVGTEGQDDTILKTVIENSEYYANLPELELENIKHHICENKTKQSLYTLYKSFADSEILHQIESELALLQFKLK